MSDRGAIARDADEGQDHAGNLLHQVAPLAASNATEGQDHAGNLLHQVAPFAASDATEGQDHSTHDTVAHAAGTATATATAAAGGQASISLSATATATATAAAGGQASISLSATATATATAAAAGQASITINAVAEAAASCTASATPPPTPQARVRRLVQSVRTKWPVARGRIGHGDDASFEHRHCEFHGKYAHHIDDQGNPISDGMGFAAFHISASPWPNTGQPIQIVAWIFPSMPFASFQEIAGSSRPLYTYDHMRPRGLNRWKWPLGPPTWTKEAGWVQAYQDSTAIGMDWYNDFPIGRAADAVF